MDVDGKKLLIIKGIKNDNPVIIAIAKVQLRSNWRHSLSGEFNCV
jgi:hypothetical protein